MAEQVNPEAIKGTAEADYIYIVGLNQNSVVNAIWSHDVYGYGGDDIIRFNPTVDWDYMSYPNFDRSIHINGGSGTDEVSLEDSHHPITVNLASGTGTVHIPPVSWWTPSGWQNADLAIEMTFYGIENVTGGQSNDHIIGDGNANFISGNNGDDSVRGGDHNDTLNGGNGKDTLKGDDGNDLLIGGNQADNLQGGEGNDTLEGGSHSDVLDGGDGNDTLEGGNHNDMLGGGDGNDRLDGGHGNDSMWGGDDQDTLEGGAGDDALYGGNGLDFAIFDTNGDMHVDLEGGIAWGGGLGTDLLHSIERVQTGGGDDDVIGTEDANVMWMGAGEDTVYGFGGNDSIKGHAGDDLLVAGSGADSVYGGDGDDRLYGEGHNDLLSGGDGNDTMNGGKGNDLLYGGDGNDRMLGDRGNDTLEGGDGHDDIDAGSGDDMIVAGNGNDTIRGGRGNDTIHTGDGLDVIHFEDFVDGAIDTIYDLNVWGDEFAFESGYFHHFDEPADNLDYLFAAQIGQDSLLFATRSSESFPNGMEGDIEFTPVHKAIAVIKGVNALLLNEQIANGNIFHVELGHKEPDELPTELDPNLLKLPDIVEEWSMF
ncbi:calcium-binding protein [uncultured Roseobacter sp.]|uniref:calcium-binding protein n=1 Tax=uncultured Roseobacter sp. TaxID=114847 RepID=UPI0026185B0A|nr:calcium-binding protein [uncultured Roseobacter sp.]